MIYIVNDVRVELSEHDSNIIESAKILKEYIIEFISSDKSIWIDQLEYVQLKTNIIGNLVTYYVVYEKLYTYPYLETTYNYEQALKIYNKWFNYFKKRLNQERDKCYTVRPYLDNNITIDLTKHRQLEEEKKYKQLSIFD